MEFKEAGTVSPCLAVCTLRGHSLNLLDQTYQSIGDGPVVIANPPVTGNNNPGFDGTSPLTIDTDLYHYPPLNLSEEPSLYDPLFGFMDGYDLHGG